MSVIRKLTHRTIPTSPVLRKISPSTSYATSITIFGKQLIKVIPIQEIIYFKSDSNYTHVALIDGSTSIVSKTLKTYETSLDGAFLRVHNSYLINPNYIRHFNLSNNKVLMRDDTLIPVSRARKPKLINYLKNK